jgi:hypothetical protein
MNKVRQFRKRAKECRDSAASAGPQIRAHYEEMAEVWDKLADQRVTFFDTEKADNVERSSPRDNGQKEKTGRAGAD